jgi:hypothetical protein
MTILSMLHILLEDLGEEVIGVSNGELIGFKILHIVHLIKQLSGRF